MKSKINFKQAELYTIAYFIVAEANKFLTRFADFKGKYTAGWVTNAHKQIGDAEDEPNEEERSEEHRTLRAKLTVVIADALNKFSALERYIIEVFPENEQPIKIDAAGGTYYDGASAEDLDDCRQMLINACEFALDNETVLLDGGENMPATFRPAIEALRDDFIVKHDAFIQAESGAEIGTGQKIQLNNAVYDEIVRSVNADAQVIFTGDDEEEIRKQFTLDHQLQLVRGAGVAGVAVRVRSGVNVFESGVAIQIVPGDFNLLTDTNGRARKLQLAAGSYTLTITKTGFVPQTITVEVQTGTVKRVNVTLIANP